MQKSSHLALKIGILWQNYFLVKLLITLRGFQPLCRGQACNRGIIFANQIHGKKCESWEKLWCIMLKSCSRPADGVVSHMKISTICWPNVILLSYASKLLPTLTLKSLFWRSQGLRCYSRTTFDLKWKIVAQFWHYFTKFNFGSLKEPFATLEKSRPQLHAWVLFRFDRLRSLK